MFNKNQKLSPALAVVAFIFACIAVAVVALSSMNFFYSSKKTTNEQIDFGINHNSSNSTSTPAGINGVPPTIQVLAASDTLPRADTSVTTGLGLTKTYSLDNLKDNQVIVGHGVNVQNQSYSCVVYVIRPPFANKTLTVQDGIWFLYTNISNSQVNQLVESFKAEILAGPCNKLNSIPTYNG